MFSFDSTTVICRLIDGKYPNYEAQFKRESKQTYYITSDLLNSIKRVSIY